VSLAWLPETFSTLSDCSELLAIRHCVFLMGPSGCGRSEVIRVLAKAMSAGCSAPSNPYLQANNRKKVCGHLVPG
jgi:ABC-type phosphate transport system ATPase subunit